jgi:DNA-binding CsgD family transcriptional regulator
MAAPRLASTSPGVFIRPRGLAGSRWALPVAVACSGALVVVFVIEATTPDDVVGMFALLPLMAAMWLLHGRLSNGVALLAALLFAYAVATEANNRPTEIYAGAAALIVAGVTRWYGSKLAKIGASPRRTWMRGAVVAVAQPTARDDRANGLRFLTQRELEVARLASGGYTALEIAGLLHISDRTVESHLAHAYGKLGINSRPALIKMGPLLTGWTGPGTRRIAGRA